MADDRTYIRVHDGMPGHPKIEPLSDGAFRTLLTLWCWSSEYLTDGRIPAAIWKKRGTPKTRSELLTAGLAEETDDGVTMHDYLEHQRSAAEVQELRAVRGASGVKANHVRWHVRRRRSDPDCPFCASDTDPNPIRSGSQSGSDADSVEESDSDPHPSHSHKQIHKDITQVGTDVASVDAGAREDDPQHSAAGGLAAHYAAGVPLTDHARAMRTIAAALTAGTPADLIRAGLDRLISEQRGCTPDQLRIAILGSTAWRPASAPKPSTTDRRVKDHLDLAAELRAEEVAALQQAPLHAITGGAA